MTGLRGRLRARKEPFAIYYTDDHYSTRNSRFVRSGWRGGSDASGGSVWSDGIAVRDGGGGMVDARRPAANLWVAYPAPPSALRPAARRQPARYPEHHPRPANR